MTEVFEDIEKDEIKYDVDGNFIDSRRYQPYFDDMDLTDEIDDFMFNTGYKIFSKEYVFHYLNNTLVVPKNPEIKDSLANMINEIDFNGIHCPFEDVDRFRLNNTVTLFKEIDIGNDKKRHISIYISSRPYFSQSKEYLFLRLEVVHISTVSCQYLIFKKVNDKYVQIYAIDQVIY